MHDTIIEPKMNPAQSASAPLSEFVQNFEFAHL